MHGSGTLQLPQPSRSLCADWQGSPAGAALWLWRTHNAVNSRLNHSAESEVLTLGLRKPQWPEPALCPTCRTPSGRWRPAAVLRTLRSLYCHAEISPCASQRSAAGMPESYPIATNSPDEAYPSLWPLLSSSLAFALLIWWVCCCRGHPRPSRPWHAPQPWSPRATLDAFRGVPPAVETASQCLYHPLVIACTHEH